MATDFIIVTDLTGSFSDDLPNISAGIPPVVRSLRDFGDDPRFSLASFRDFSDSFGSDGNGYRADLPLTTSVEELEETINGYSAGGGGDGPEAQGTALISAAEGRGLDLRPGSDRVVILSTDAVDKIGRDGRPTLDEVRSTLEETNTTPVFLATDGAKANYDSLVSDLGRGITLEIDRDSSDLTDSVRESVARLLGEDIGEGTEGDDTLPGTDGGDVIFARGGDDTVDGGSGEDTLDGGSGDDEVRGGSGDDEVRGGTGEDTVDGGPGNDVIQGNLDRDFLTGGPGDDTFVGTVDELAGDVITDFAAGDRIVFADTTFGPDDMSVTFASAILDIDTDGDGVKETRLTLEGDFPPSTEFDVTSDGPDTVITLADVPEDLPTIAPNAILTLTDSTPDTFFLGSGLTVELFGNTSGKTLNVPDGAGAVGIDVNTTINLEGASSDFSFSRDGTTLQVVNGSDDVILGLNAGTRATSEVVFSDGSATMSVSGGQIAFGGESFADGERAGSITVDPSKTSSDVFDSRSGGTPRDLDALSGTPTSPATTDVSGDSVVLMDSVAQASVTEVSGFGADDTIEIDGTADVELSSSGGNTNIEFDDGSGLVSEITLVGVSGFFTTVSEFNATSDLGDITFA